MVSGEAGFGKTAPLEYLNERVSDCQVISLTAIQSEMELARAHLLYGEWLRRQRHPGDARDQCCARPSTCLMPWEWRSFSERARRELRATGETRAPQRTTTSRSGAAT